MHSFSVIIVSWNALNHLKTFLPSVVQTEYPDFEILLADNASTDGSAEWVKQEFPEIRIISLEQNYGYCGGNNRAARHADGDILLFLNNDVKVEPNWLNHINTCFEKDSSVAALQPKMLSYEDPEKFEYAGAAGGFLDRYGYPFCRGRLFDTLEKDRGQYDNEADLLWASGAAFAIKRDLFEKFSGFDEDFEFHMEEIDLCWQLWNRGYKVRFCPQSVVYHLGGGSMPMGSPRKIYYNYRNNLKMLVKNYSTKSLFIHLPVRGLLDLVSAMRMLLSGQGEDFVAVMKAYLHFFTGIRGTFRKRKLLQEKRVIASDPPVIKGFSVVRAYFLNGKRHYKELAH